MFDLELSVPQEKGYFAEVPRRIYRVEVGPADDFDTAMRMGCEAVEQAIGLPRNQGLRVEHYMTRSPNHEDNNGVSVAKPKWLKEQELGEPHSKYPFPLDYPKETEPSGH